MKISVGAQAVNELLGGGIESRCITEIYGEFRCAHLKHCFRALAGLPARSHQRLPMSAQPKRVLL